MPKTVVIAVLVLLVILGLTGGMLYLAYGVGNRPPRQVYVPGISDTTIITSFENGSAAVVAPDRSAAYSALGYIHAQDHAWTMALWRRSALGRLSEWFGDSLLPLDHLSRRLAFGRLAKETFAALPDQERMILDAYARGVNAAFSLEEPRLANEFILLETRPEPWEAWHSLAIERLFAWMAAERPQADSIAAATEDLREFFETDRFLQRWLHLHGFRNGLAWTRRDSLDTSLVQRHVYGASALPIFHEVRLEWPGASPISGAAIIGTPFMPAGKTDSRAWAILLSGSMNLFRAVRDTAAAAPVYDRIVSADGREHLLVAHRTEGEIFFPISRVPVASAARSRTRDTLRTAVAGQVFSADTSAAVSRTPPAPIEEVQTSRPGWVLSWSGLHAGTDASAWLSLTEGGQPAFELFDGDGLMLNRDGGEEVLGDPLFRYSFEGGQAVGNSEWSYYAAVRLDSMVESATVVSSVGETMRDRRSTWAATLAPPLTDAAVAVPDQPHLVTEALTYLRNWDYSYDRASIAASIFDTWMTVYRDSLGRLPEPRLPDSLLGESLVRYETLLKAVERLARVLGDDPSQWRWEELERHRYYFPVWSADTLLSQDVGAMPETRYAPIDLPGAGHPTALAFGPSVITSELDAPAIWESWISTQDWSVIQFRRRRFPANRFFGRYLVSDRMPELSTLPDPDNPRNALTLIPK